MNTALAGRIELFGTSDVFSDCSGYATASSLRNYRIVLHPSALLSFPPRYHSMWAPLRPLASLI